MRLPEPLQKQWRDSSRVALRNLCISDEGVILGKTVLAPFRNGNLGIDSKRISTLLSVAYAKYVPASVTRSFHHAERCFRRGDSALANMHLALSGMHAVDLEKAQRLFAADWALSRGIPVKLLLKMAGLRKDDSQGDDSEDDGSEYDSSDGPGDDSGGESESDFDAKHPRWPAGSPGGIGGEFAPQDSSNATARLHEALSDAAATATSAAANAGQDAKLSMGVEDRVDSDIMGPVVMSYATIELMGSEAAAAMASRIQSTVSQVMATMGAAGAVLSEKTQELSDAIQDVINDWLGENGQQDEESSASTDDKLRELGTEIQSGQFRQGEADTAQLLQDKLGVVLQRSSTPVYDWIDERGITYDAVGPVPSQYFNADSFNNATDEHLLTQGLDKVVINATGLTPEQQIAIEMHISQLSPKNQLRIILFK